MSDNWLHLIPTDPAFEPTQAAQESARIIFAKAVPDADEVSASLDDAVTFVDGGSNFESVRCPACHADLMEWWLDAMDRAAENQFRDLQVRPPCCDIATSLNDLVYDFPQGFSRFRLEAMNPNIAVLPAAVIEELERVLGCRLRCIWQHV